MRGLADQQGDEIGSTCVQRGVFRSAWHHRHRARLIVANDNAKAPVALAA